MKEYFKLKECIQEIKSQKVMDVAIQTSDSIESKNAILIIFSSGDVLWTFHNWCVARGDYIVIHSNSMDNNIIQSSIKELKGKDVVNVVIEVDTMRLSLFLKDNFKVEFSPVHLYEQRSCLWFFKYVRNHTLFYINSVSEIVIRNTFQGDEFLLDNLHRRLLELIGQQVTYSSAGGGNSSILLLETQNKNCLWLWQYWEIWQGEHLLANSEDDDTPVTGKMAVAAELMNGEYIEHVYLDEDTLDCTLLLTEKLRLEVITTYVKKKRALRNWEYGIPKMNLCYEITSSLDIHVRKYSESYD